MAAAEDEVMKNECLQYLRNTSGIYIKTTLGLAFYS
jgi:hypothetical protein